jgi:ABC-type dipeptide/oligopeptide/nickel transport system ATPase subunit
MRYSTSVLALFAEQGSAKSTSTRIIVDLIDPSPGRCDKHLAMQNHG